MKRLVSCTESRDLDASSRNIFGLDSLLLMEKASIRMWDCLLRHIENSPDLSHKGRNVKILALCGKGDNGGDSLAMLRHARSEGFKKLAALISSQVLSASTELQMGFLQKAGIPCLKWAELKEEERARLYAESDIVLDGILGSGILGPAGGEALDMIALTKASVSPRPVGDSEIPAVSAFSDALGKPSRALLVSVDIPSGLGDLWTETFPAVDADLSLCLEPIKDICFAPSARRHCGRILSVGGVFPHDLIACAGTKSLLKEQDLQGLLDPVTPEAYKMSRGRLGIFAGSLGSAGAALLCAKAAAAAGVGYIYLYVDEALYPVVAPAAESTIVRTWKAETEIPYCDAVLAGPGWGTGDERIPMLQTLGSVEDRPLILDADAIRLLAKQSRLRDSFLCPVALTPHPGEYREFAGSLSIGESEPFSLSIARMAECMNALIIAKSHITWIQGKESCYVWEGLTPELGVAGSGDVLAGLFAGLLARKIARLRGAGNKKAILRKTIERSMEEAACAAVIAHGSAGRRLAQGSGWFDASQLIEACAQILHGKNNGEGKDT